MRRISLMCLAVMAVCALFTTPSTAGPQASPTDEINCSSSCPVNITTPTSATAPEDCAIDFATCVVDRPSECDISNPTNIEDQQISVITSSALMQSESNHNNISKVIGAIEVFNVGTSISVAILSTGRYYSKAEENLYTKSEVSKRLICMVPMDTNLDNYRRISTS